MLGSDFCFSVPGPFPANLFDEAHMSKTINGGCENRGMWWSTYWRAAGAWMDQREPKLCSKGQSRDVPSSAVPKAAFPV